MAKSRRPLVSSSVAALGFLASPIVASQFTQNELPVHDTVYEYFPADIDGDGRKELIGTYGPDYDEMGLFEVDARGQFRFVKSLFPDSRSAERVQLADLNGDGIDDLLGQRAPFPGYTSPLYLSIGAGNLEFAPPVFLADAAGCSRFVPADVDADGDVDIIHYEGDSRSQATSLPSGATVKWRENDGAGQFGAPIEMQASPGNVLRATPADLDNDGDIDFVAERQSDRALVVLRNVAGVLHEETTGFPAVPFQDLYVADFTADGFTDVLVVTTQLPQAYDFGLELMVNDGAGALGAPQTILPASSNFLSVVAVLNHNQDGWPDIAYVTTEPGERWRLNLLLGDGTGAFPSSWASPPVDGRSPQNLVAGDWDDDGDDDLIHTDRTGASGSPRRRIHLSMSDSLGTPEPIHVSSRVFERSSLNIVADIDGDGLDDLTRSTSSGLWWSRSDVSSPQFDDPVSLDGNTGISPGRPRASADFDGDGDSEILLQRARSQTDIDLVLLDRSPDGSVSTTNLTTATSLAVGNYVEPVDWDGDGDIDVLFSFVNPYAPAWLENMGAGLFASPVSLAAPTARYDAYQTGDFNGDGRLDLLAEPPRILPGGPSVWYERLASGGLAAPVHYHGGKVSEAIVHDVNSDGFDDVLWRGQSDGSVYAFHGGPAGLSSTRTTLIADAWLYGGDGSLSREDWVLMDADLDGQLDLVMLDGYHQSIGVFMATPGGGFAQSPLVVHPPSNPMSFELPSAVLRTGDFDGDGATDLLLRDSHLHMTWWQNQSAGAPSIVGVPVCQPETPNSSGRAGRMEAYGADEAARNQLTLYGMDLPRGAAGFFITSQASRPPLPVVGSMGQLCLDGAIGRYVAPGQVAAVSSAGTMRLQVDLASMPTSGGTISALPGSTWFFQAWHRDLVAGTLSSNFSSAVGVTFR